MSILDPKWKYTNAEESRKPGYLKNKFARIQREQKEQAEQESAIRLEKIQRVRTIR